MFNILVADDVANIRRLYEYTLEKNGFKVFTAENGEAALDVIEKQGCGGSGLTTPAKGPRP